MLIWDLLLANVLKLKAKKADRIELGVFRIREMLFSWYDTEAEQGRNHTRVRKFVRQSLGTPKKRKLALYGAETNGLVSFAVELLDRYGPALGKRARYHKAACRTLNAIIEAIRTYPTIFPPVAIETFCDNVKEHRWAVKKLGIRVKPKHHFLVEMAGRLSSHGAPAYQACWSDESANFQLKEMCSQAHRAVWHGRILAAWGSKTRHKAATFKRMQSRKRRVQ